ncbi:MAG: ankyrin repeat domain-containing protein [Rhodoferax sp.]|uniref:ankyrin repeat domain-containing protein n=1 Tax=Rhodoferax sp. TaxID=50421 RepID=UPI0027182C1F|nr:ankyrin repeat domain-containing protein [Rhodoferax sp.]MDO8450822.1 ankyrin repeat domain-containing protein [Rhodoferax sp.]
MPSSEFIKAGWRGVGCTLLGVVLVGCAHDPKTLLYRDRLEQGAIAPEEFERFRTSQAEVLALEASASDPPPQLASALDLGLLKAAAIGDVVRTRQLIKDGAQVNAVDEWGNTALLVAAREGEIDSARLLLRSLADVEGRGGAMTPLAAAALRGHTHMVQLLLRAGANVNAVGLNELTPLMNAVKLDRLGVARVLLKAGASTRVLDRAGDNLLAVAVTENYPDMLALLLKQGVDPDLADGNGLTALYWAEYLNRPALAQLLRNAGADSARKKTEIIVSQPYSFGEF